MTLKKVKRSHNEVRQLLTGLGPTTTTSTPTTTRQQMPPPTGPGLTLTHTTSTTSTGGTSTTSTGTTSVSTTSATSAAVSTASHSSIVQVTRTSTQHRTTTSSIPSATQSSDDSSGMGIGSIAGIGVAAIVGIGVLTAFLVWMIRRRKKNNTELDEEPFNRDSFMRHSTAIPDDDTSSGLPPLRRPAPDMIERQPSPGYGSGYNGYPPQNSFNYNVQPSYQSGSAPYSPNSATAFGPGGAPATPLPYNPGFGAPYDQQDYGHQMHGSGYADLTRGGPDDGYYQQQQYDHYSPPHSPNAPPAPPKDQSGIYVPAAYPELTPPTAAAQQGRVISVPETAYDGRETPVQLGFAPVPQNNAHRGPQAGRNGRPDTMYDPDDAYGGI